jgi:hypothetical protein
MTSAPDLILAKVEVPFELWLVLVICTGGIYLIIAVIRYFSEDRTGTERTAIDLEVIFSEVIAAVLSDREEEKLGSIFLKYSFNEDQKAQLVTMVKLAVAEFATADTYDVASLQEKLIAYGIPDEIAKKLIRAVSRIIITSSKTSEGPAPPTTVPY